MSKKYSIILMTILTLVASVKGRLIECGLKNSDEIYKVIQILDHNPQYRGYEYIIEEDPDTHTFCIRVVKKRPKD